MELSEALQYALQGDAILFLGSGASSEVLNQNGDRMPIGSQLAKRLCADSESLQEAVDFFESTKEEQGYDGKAALIDFLTNQFRSSGESSFHRILASIPWKRIYTTNCDDILERSFVDSVYHLTSVTPSTKPINALKKDSIVYLHINGSINNITKETLDQEFKLTDFSYTSSSFEGNEWGAFFSQDIHAASAVIFVGFSMSYDLDIKRLVNTITSSKCFFVIRPEDEEKPICKTLSKYGNVLCIGLSGLESAIEKAIKDFSSKKLEYNIPMTNFLEISQSDIQGVTTPTKAEIDKFYFFGKRCNSIYFDLGGPQSQIICREVTPKIISDIQNGINCIFLHSDIGGGKTETLQQLFLQLPNNIRKYILIDQNDKISNEIDEICSQEQKCVVVIENFFNYSREIKALLSRNFRKNICLILTARTSIFESRYSDIYFNNISNTVYSLNSLTSKEIQKLALIMKENGFYPEKDLIDFPLYIKKKCNRKLQSVLLTTFDHYPIAIALKDKFKKIKENSPNSFRLLFFLIVVKVMSLELSFYDGLNLLFLNSYSYDLKKDTDLLEFIDWRGEFAQVKSIAMCVWLLKELNLAKETIDLLIELAKSANVGFETNIRYRNLLGNIISYKHLKFILRYIKTSDSIKKELIDYFYGSISSLSYYNEKYYFWLQYAISSIEIGDYLGAEIHFNAAYSTIPEEMSPFEINNQYARFSLLKLLKDDVASLEMSSFHHINDLLLPTGKDCDKEFYCYKIAAEYYPKIKDKFYTGLSASDKKEFVTIVNNQYNSCSKYSLKAPEGEKDKLIEFQRIFMRLSI